MSRSFMRRRNDRYDRLVERAQYLTNRMCRADITEAARSHATRERSALLWVLEEVDRLDQVEDTLGAAVFTEGDKLHRIEAICESRHRPTEADLARTPQLAGSSKS